MLHKDHWSKSNQNTYKQGEFFKQTPKPLSISSSNSLPMPQIENYQLNYTTN